jgi:uncharacterized membrane protein (UPF0127 family)
LHEGQRNPAAAGAPVAVWKVAWQLLQEKRMEAGLLFASSGREGAVLLAIVPILPRQNARAKSSFFSAFLAAGVLACHGSAATGNPPGNPSGIVGTATVGTPSTSWQHGTVRFETPRGPWAIDVELARSPEEHAQGLMYRRELGQGKGMLFLFAEESHQRFWMHNTLLRLDMIFVGEDRSVVGVVQNAEPQTDSGREVAGNSRYVLEVAGGEAAAHGVGPGARMQLIGIDESAPQK